MDSHAPQIKVEYEILNKKKTVVECPPMEAEVVVKIKGKNGEKERKYPFKSFVYNMGAILDSGFFATETADVAKKTTGTLSADSGIYMMKLTESAEATTQSSGSLVTGQSYIITVSAGGADWTNVGAGANTVGTVFVATGTTPTSWGTGSVTGYTLYGIWVGDINNNSGLSITAAGVTDVIQYTDYTLYRKLINDGYTPDTDMLHGAVTVSSVDAYSIKVSRTFTCNRVAGLKISEVGLVGKDTANTNYYLLCRDVLVDSALGTAYVSVANGELVTIEYRFTIGSTSGYTTQFLNVLQSLFTDAAVSSTNTAASTASVDFTAARTNIDAAPATATATTATHGILIGGTVSTVPTTNPTLSVSSYKLTNPLSNAQCTISALVAVALAYASGETTFGAYRDFTNDTTNNVYVNEAALYLKHATLTEYFMPVRTLVTNGSLPYQLVQPGKTLRIKYYFVLPIGTTLLSAS